MTARLEPATTAVIAVDFQERFAGAVTGFDAACGRAAILVAAARILNIQVTVTEQYPRGLGHTVPVVADALVEFEAIEKSVFSAARSDGFKHEPGNAAIVCGVEAHVCVAQTVLDLLDAGSPVFVAADAVASRSDSDRTIALERLRAEGAVISTVEALLFELLAGADHPHFREVQALIK